MKAFKKLLKIKKSNIFHVNRLYKKEKPIETISIEDVSIKKTLTLMKDVPVHELIRYLKKHDLYEKIGEQYQKDSGTDYKSFFGFVVYVCVCLTLVVGSTWVWKPAAYLFDRSQNNVMELIKSPTDRKKEKEKEEEEIKRWGPKK